MHKIKRKVQQKQESRILSFTPVRTYFLLFLMLYLLLVICAGSLLTIRSMKQSAQAAQQSAAAQISQPVSYTHLNNIVVQIETGDVRDDDVDTVIQ